MNRSWGVRLSMTAAASALSLAFITGCSSDSDEGKKDTAADAKATAAAAPAAKASTAAELKKLLLAAGDIAGYTIEATEGLVPTAKTEAKLDKAACGPLVWSSLALPPGDTTVGVSNSLKEDKKPPTSGSLDAAALLDATRTLVGLSSYDGDGAQKAMKSVSDSITACATGYTSTTDGEASKVTKVAAEKGTGGGDEALAFVETVDVGGETATVHGEVIRKGNTVATFYTVNFSAFAGDGKMPMNPPAIITAQLTKLK
ncbi:hypothetical protein [Streptomyces acidiscabies]|uniref:hypothetical protein n=1 Tax=Streptomyces acidiscabies TaxID=42234 RepID=UPI00073F2AE8|nr:hypothetical protein [Streptomyces acidiscabies]GAQ51447.1 hypothetical protein a10_01227 [Streptomyces acidiscabies]